MNLLFEIRIGGLQLGSSQRCRFTSGGRALGREALFLNAAGFPFFPVSIGLFQANGKSASGARWRILWKEILEGNLGELRIAQEPVDIGIDEFDHLGEEMEVLGAVVPICFRS